MAEESPRRLMGCIMQDDIFRSCCTVWLSVSCSCLVLSPMSSLPIISIQTNSHALQHSDANINTVAKGCRKKYIRVLHNKFMKFYLLRNEMTILPCPSTCSVFIHFSRALLPFLSNKLKLNFPFHRKLCSANFSSLFDCISPSQATAFTSRQH